MISGDDVCQCHLPSQDRRDEGSLKVAVPYHKCRDLPDVKTSWWIGVIGLDHTGVLELLSTERLAESIVN